MEKKVKDSKAELDALQKLLMGDKYNNQKYKKGSMVEIPAELFVGFIQSFTALRSLSGQIERNLGASTMAIHESLNSTDEIAYRLMKKHIENIDKGLTETAKEDGE